NLSVAQRADERPRSRRIRRRDGGRRARGWQKKRHVVKFQSFVRPSSPARQYFMSNAEASATTTESAEASPAADLPANPPAPEPATGGGEGSILAGDVQAIDYFKEAHAAIRHQLAKVIVGQDKVIDELLIAIFTRSHALLVGVPGLAKTLLISTLSETLKL